VVVVDIVTLHEARVAVIVEAVEDLLARREVPVAVFVVGDIIVVRVGVRGERLVVVGLALDRHGPRLRDLVEVRQEVAVGVDPARARAGVELLEVGEAVGRHDAARQVDVFVGVVAARVEEVRDFPAVREQVVVRVIELRVEAAAGLRYSYTLGSVSLSGSWNLSEALAGSRS